MIDRYSRPEMSSVLAEQAKLGRWLAVEQAVLVVLAEDGIVPGDASDALARVTDVDAEAVRAREAEIHHDLAAFVDVVAASAPAAAGWIHFGLTSSDVVDTALGLQLRDAGGLVLGGIERLRGVVLARAFEHRDTIMLGRTHGMPAEPITFGAKLAGWWHQLGRDEARVRRAFDDAAVGKLSGAVGLYSGLTADQERRALERLGLERDPSATQIVQRDRLAALLASIAVLGGTLERIGLEVRHLQRAEVAEASEPFARSQKGSSAMPHKRNPIVAEQLCGLARVLRANAGVAFENVALWHERDISHSSTERIVVVDSLLLVDYLLDRAAWLVEGLDVDAARMRENLESQGGLVASQGVLLALVEAGMSRDDAYREVQAAASSVRDGSAGSFADAIARSEVAGALLSSEAVRALCDPSRVPAGVADVFASLPALAHVD